MKKSLFLEIYVPDNPLYMTSSFTHTLESDHLYFGCTDGRIRPAP